MAHVIFGKGEINVSVDEYLVHCPSCEVDRFADVMFLVKYVHFYFIPVFPTDKEVTIICETCGLKRYNIPLTERLIKNFDEVKKRFRYPLYTYTASIVLVVLIFFAVLFHR